MEYDLNLYQMEDDLNNLPNGRQPPPPPRDDDFPNLTEGWLSSSKILIFLISKDILNEIQLLLHIMRNH